MYDIGEQILWGWVSGDKIWTQGLVSTEAVAKMKAVEEFGEERMWMGEVKAFRVTIEPLTDEEQQQERERFEEWKRSKRK